MLVFAAETSCDETSICLMKSGKIIEHFIFSQEIHEKFGGVVPELASRSHLQILQQATNELFENSKIKPEEIDIFTATCGPGLIGSLLVGATFTKSLSLGYKKPFIPMNHLLGHVLSTSYNNKILYPNIVLLITGGHTQVYLLENNLSIKLLGETLDDALGEAFDKVAKLLGLGYPGGKEIEEKARHGDENFFVLPKPLIEDKNFNFSFSGIKTHVNLIKRKNQFDEKFVKDMSASFQKNISDLLMKKIKNGLKLLKEKKIKIKSISVVGGVANNNYIKKNFENLSLNEKIELYYPIKEMTSDNAAMIAWGCHNIFTKNKKDIFFKPNPRMNISEFML